MVVRLKLYAAIAQKLGNINSIELNKDLNLEELIEFLSLTKEEAGFILVNGKKEESGYKLKDGDTVFILSYIGGG